MSSKKKSILKAIEKGQDTLTEKELEERGQERLPAMPEDEPAKPKKKAAPKKTEKAEPSPAATSAISAETAPEGAGEEPAKVMGQPRKYNEPLKHIGFKIPVSADDKLKILSQLHGQTTTQYLLKWIDGEYEKNREAIDAILKFRKEV